MQTADRIGAAAAAAEMNPFAGCYYDASGVRQTRLASRIVHCINNNGK